MSGSILPAATLLDTFADDAPDDSITAGTGRDVICSVQGQAATRRTGSYTPALGDAGTMIEMDSQNATIFTVPPASAVPFPVGTELFIAQLGEGAVLVSPGDDAVSVVAAGLPQTRDRYSVLTLRQRDANVWIVSGDIAPDTAPQIDKTDWWSNPGRDGGYWKLPLQVGAKWITSGAMIDDLRLGTPGVQDGSYNWVLGTDGEPLVEVIGPSGHSITVRMPLGTEVTPVIGGVDKTQPYLLWSGAGALCNTVTVAATGSVISLADWFGVADGSGAIAEDVTTGMSSFFDALGVVTEWELRAALADDGYVIPHMLHCAMGTSQISADGPVWPTHDLRSATHTGAVPQGCTLGIPADVAMPTGRTRGFELLWTSAQHFGWQQYAVGSREAVEIWTRSLTAETAALVAEMDDAMPEIVASLCILSWDGTAGSQYGTASAKGMVGGVRDDAFPAPPPLDYAPTGGLAVYPHTFGAWFQSGYDVPSGPTD